MSLGSMVASVGLKVLGSAIGGKKKGSSGSSNAALASAINTQSYVSKQGFVSRQAAEAAERADPKYRGKAPQETNKPQSRYEQNVGIGANKLISDFNTFQKFIDAYVAQAVRGGNTSGQVNALIAARANKDRLSASDTATKIPPQQLESYTS
tara:strand:- start:1108 stop:1563 length:456 start_codon:yes stop_codon:yes gene_type:complete